MKMVLSFSILFCLFACKQSKLSTIIAAKDSFYQVETLNLILAAVKTDFPDWKIEGYRVVDQMIPFWKQWNFLTQKVKDQVEFEPLAIEKIIDQSLAPFENNLTTDKNSAFYFVFSTIYKDFYTVEVFEYYKRRKNDFEIFGFHQGESLLFTFKYFGEHQKPLLLDKIVVHNN